MERRTVSRKSRCDTALVHVAATAAVHHAAVRLAAACGGRSRVAFSRSRRRSRAVAPASRYDIPDIRPFVRRTGSPQICVHRTHNDIRISASTTPALTRLRFGLPGRPSTRSSLYYRYRSLPSSPLTINSWASRQMISLRLPDHSLLGTTLESRSARGGPSSTATRKRLPEISCRGEACCLRLKIAFFMSSRKSRCCAIATGNRGVPRP